MSEEDEVSLVVEGDHPPPLELGIMGEQRRKHPCHCVPNTSAEVVQHYLWLVRGDSSMTLKQ